jgi:hypothetical protein
MSVVTSWRGGPSFGDWWNAANWSDGVPTPNNGDTAFLVGQSSASLGYTELDGLNISLVTNTSGSPNLRMTNASLGYGSTLFSGGIGPAVGLTLQGGTTNVGTIYGYENVLQVKVDYGSSLANSGTIVSQGNETTPAINISLTPTSGLVNLGGIYAANGGSVTINWGGTQQDGTAIWNEALIDASAGGTVVLGARHDPAFTTSYGIVGNDGRLLADGGQMYVSADVTQAGGGYMEAANGGVLDIAGAVTGGTVVIDSTSLGLVSRLDFALPSHGGVGSPLAGGLFESRLDLVGAGEISFNHGGTTVTAFDFDPAADTLKIYGQIGGNGHYQMANLQLVGSYSADQFSIIANAAGGHDVLYADPARLTS